MSPYRLPSPPEVEPPETEHPYVDVLRAQQTRTRMFAAAAVVAAASGLVGLVVSRSAHAEARRSALRERAEAAQREHFETTRSAIDAARERAFRAQGVFEREMERVRAGGDAVLGPCPARASRVVISVLEDRTHGLPSRTVDDVLVDARRAEMHLAAGRYEQARAYAVALASDKRYGRELVVVTREAKKPEVTSPSTYVPGEVRGRAYLWDFAEGRVLCAADVHATSSREIGFAYADATDAPTHAGRTSRLLTSLSDDLTAAVERAATTALFASR